MIHARSVFVLLIAAAMASGQGVPDKKLKQGEYDPYNLNYAQNEPAERRSRSVGALVIE